jgi:hypothetical protein
LKLGEFEWISQSLPTGLDHGDKDFQASEFDGPQIPLELMPCTSTARNRSIFGLIRFIEVAAAVLPENAATKSQRIG